MKKESNKCFSNRIWLQLLNQEVSLDWCARLSTDLIAFRNYVQFIDMMMFCVIIYLSRSETDLPDLQCCSWQEQSSARCWNHLWFDSQHPRFPLYTQSSTLELPSNGSIQVPFPEFSDYTITPCGNINKFCLLRGGPKILFGFYNGRLWENIWKHKYIISQ